MASKKVAGVAAEGAVKSYTRTEKGIKVTFEDLLYSSGQVLMLDQWIDEHRKVRVTIDPTEELLTDPKEDPRPNETAKD